MVILELLGKQLISDFRCKKTNSMTRGISQFFFFFFFRKTVFCSISQKWVIFWKFRKEVFTSKISQKRFLFFVKLAKIWVCESTLAGRIDFCKIYLKNLFANFFPKYHLLRKKFQKKKPFFFFCEINQNNSFWQIPLLAKVWDIL